MYMVLMHFGDINVCDYFNVVGVILSSVLGSIWNGIMWFCRYLDDFGIYSITIIVSGLHTYRVIPFFKLR